MDNPRLDDLRDQLLKTIREHQHIYATTYLELIGMLELIKLDFYTELLEEAREDS